MIARIWHGWTTPENAERYETLLRTEIAREIVEREIPGFRAIELLRRDAPPEVQFTTIMHFDTSEAVLAFAGDDYEQAVVPPKAREVLARFDQRVAHYEVRMELRADAPR